MNHAAMLCVLLMLHALIAPSAHATDGHWPFVPSTQARTVEPALDLRSLNEKQSGETGFGRLTIKLPRNTMHAIVE